jgi:hypothetical protein
MATAGETAAAAFAADPAGHRGTTKTDIEQEQEMYSRRFVLASLASSTFFASAAKIRPARAAEPVTIRAGWVVLPADLLPAWRS